MTHTTGQFRTFGGHAGIGATLGRRTAGAAALLAVLTACSTSTNGSGTGAGPTAAINSGPSSAPVPTDTPKPPTSSATGSETASSSVAPPPSKPVRTATVHAGAATYLIKVWAETTDTDCAGHAYGTPVINFLMAHPCHSMSRLLATTVVDGKPVGFNASTIAFDGKFPQSYTIAGKFRALVTRDGTGNISDLLREGRRLPSGPTAVPSPGAFSAASQDAGVTIVDAWYLHQPTKDNDPALVQMAHDIYLQY